jgi:hypothetical protein
VNRHGTVHTGAADWFVIRWGPNIGTIGGQIIALTIRMRKKIHTVSVVLIPAIIKQHVLDDANAETAGGLYLHEHKNHTKKIKYVGGKVFCE